MTCKVISFITFSARVRIKTLCNESLFNLNLVAQIVTNR